MKKRTPRNKLPPKVAVMAGPQSNLRRYMTVLRRQLPELRARYHVCFLGIFGSYVRGTQRQGSDLDVLVEFVHVPSLFEFVDLEERLSALLGVRVDLVMKDTLKPLIGQQILNEVVGL